MSLCLSHSFPPPLSSSFKKKYVFHFYMKGRVIARRGDRRRGLLSTGSLPNGCSGQSCVVSSLPSHAISRDVGQKCSSQTWASTHMGCRCRRYRVSLLGHGPGARIPFSLHFFPFDTCMCLPCFISQKCATGSMCLCKNVTGDWWLVSDLLCDSILKGELAEAVLACPCGAGVRLQQAGILGFDGHWFHLDFLILMCLSSNKFCLHGLWEQKPNWKCWFLILIQSYILFIEFWYPGSVP